MSELIMLFAVVVLVVALVRIRRARRFDEWNHGAIVGYQDLLGSCNKEIHELTARLANAQTSIEFQQCAIGRYKTTNKSMVSIVRKLQAELDKANRSRSALRGQITKLKKSK